MIFYLSLNMNDTKNYEFTIIVPLYNEADNLPALEERFTAWLPLSPKKTCVLFVDDGSTDTSLQLIKEICARHPHFYFLSLSKNSGLSAALKAGFDTVLSPWLGYIDADLQTAPEDFPLLLEHTHQAPMVIGIRADRHDSGFKKLQSKIANGFRRKMTGDNVRDTGCPLKVIATPLAKKLPMFTGLHRFLPALASLYGANVIQIPVRHFPRVAGVSKYHLWNRLKGPFMDCFAYRWMKTRIIDNQIADSFLEKK